MTYGGKLIKQLIDTGKYYLVNSSEKTIGGPFTRYDPRDPSSDDSKAALDLMIISIDLMKYLCKLEIDKNMNWTPCRSIGPAKLRFTDHYPLLLILKNIPLKTGDDQTI